MVVIDFVWLRSELKNITAESRGAHVPQCPIAVDAINVSSFLHVIYTISSRLVIWSFSIYSIIRIGHHSPTISWFDCSLKITSRSFWYAAPHLIVEQAPPTFRVLISSIHHHHPALLHRHLLILDSLLTFLVAFSTLVVKVSVSQSLSLHSHMYPFLKLISWNYNHSLFVLNSLELWSKKWLLLHPQKCKVMHVGHSYQTTYTMVEHDITRTLQHAEKEKDRSRIDNTEKTQN